MAFPRRTNHLMYNCLNIFISFFPLFVGDSAGTRTQDPHIKSVVLWPTELRSQLSVWRCKGNMADRSLFSFPKKSSFFVQKRLNFPENNEKGNKKYKKTKSIEIKDCTYLLFSFSLGWGGQVLTKHKSEFSNPLICPFLTSKCVANISGGSLSCQPTVVTLQPKREKS